MRGILREREREWFKLNRGYGELGEMLNSKIINKMLLSSSALTITLIHNIISFT